MAISKKSSSAELDDNKQYSVTLTAAIRVGRAIIRPKDGVILKGKVIKELPDGTATDIHEVANGPDQSA